MRLRLLKHLLFFVVLATGTAVAAQDIYVQNEPQIILPVGRLPWQGNVRELRRMESDPVPESFHAACENRDTLPSWECRRNLLSWHINFGTARSAEDALTYVETRIANEYGLKPGLGERYLALSAGALREVEGYLAAEQLTYESFMEKDRRITAAGHPTLARMRDLQSKLQHAGELAELYGRAADWFHSPDLLSKAEHYRAIVAEARGDPLGTLDAEQVLRRITRISEPAFLDLSIAVARAAIYRDEASVLAAHVASAEAYDPAYQRIDSEAEGMATWLGKEFKYYRFRVSLLADELNQDVGEHDGTYLGEEAFDDIDRHFWPRRPIRSAEDYPRFRNDSSRIIEALTAQGEHDLRLSASACKDDGDFEHEILNRLYNGERIISPTETSAIYRRIGQLYVQLFAIAERCSADGDSLLAFPGYAAKARFFEAYLEKYDHIVFGR